MAQNVVLYAEDEEDDALLLKLAFEKVGLTQALLVVDDGEAAIEYLSGTGQFADRSQFPLPSLVLLDLNIPRVSGLQVLQWIRERPQFSSLPVVIYTSSEQPRDITEARQLGANDYIVKPSLMKNICDRVREVKARWLQQP